MSAVHPISEEAAIQAYNCAFEELGLAWHWDHDTYVQLPSGPTRVLAYVQREHPHLLRSYDGDFLVAAVEQTMSRFTR